MPWRRTQLLPIVGTSASTFAGTFRTLAWPNAAPLVELDETDRSCDPQLAEPPSRPPPLGRPGLQAGHSLANGMRVRARSSPPSSSDRAMKVEMRRARESEVSRDRFTSLDRVLEQRARDNVVDVGAPPRGSVEPSVLIARGSTSRASPCREPCRPTSGGWPTAGESRCARWQRAATSWKRIHAAVAGDPSRYHVVGRGQERQASGRKWPRRVRPRDEQGPDQ